ncbi:MAG: hypothetical protein ACTHJR_13055 [Sphingomonas sp.]|uniref:hypothetical protein n=1 Tax=Sphingomonas sp. TaxID=28214 RepID=UPI003F7E23E9
MAEDDKTTVIKTDGGGGGGGAVALLAIAIIAIAVVLFLVFGQGLLSNTKSINADVKVDTPSKP